MPDLSPVIVTVLALSIKLMAFPGLVPLAIVFRFVLMLDLRCTSLVSSTSSVESLLSRSSYKLLLCPSDGSLS